MSAKKPYNIINHEYDVVVVGAGGSGLRAALGCGLHGGNDKLCQCEVTLLLVVYFERQRLPANCLFGNESLQDVARTADCLDGERPVQGQSFNFVSHAVFPIVTMLVSSAWISAEAAKV